MDKRLRVLVERIDACAAWSHLLTAEDLRSAAALSGERRRREFLAWRSLVRRELGPVDIGYAPSGAPRLACGGLSVSHCDVYVAVYLADGPCGVDVERLNRNFRRVIPRYATPQEAALCDDPRLDAALWCAKEALYKYAGRKGLDLRRDLLIERVDFTQGRMSGRICGGEAIPIGLRTFDGHLLVWVG